MALLKAFCYFALWILVQLAVEIFLGVALALVKGQSAMAYYESLVIHISIICNCLTVLLLAGYSFLRGSSLSERAYINKMPARFSVSMVIMGVSFCYTIAVLLGLIDMAGLFPDSWVTMLEETNSSLLSAPPVINFICVVIMAPVLEEILFRGFILGALKKAMHPWVAIFISALVFGIAHGTPIGIIYATALGIVMGWICVKFDSVVPSIIFHMAYNGAVSYNEGVSVIAVIIAVPVLIFEFIDINRYFRGEKR